MLMEMTAASDGARALVSDVLLERARSVEHDAETVSSAIHERLDVLDDDLFPGTLASTRANIGLITSMIGAGASPTRFTAPPEALTYARGYVHEGLSLDCLSQAYRFGQQAYSRLWLEQLKSRATDAEQLADAMGWFSDWLFGYIESMNEPLGEVYTAEHERAVRGGIAMRSEEVRSILAGGHVDVTESSSRLRYRLDGHHVGFVIWADADGQEQMAIGDGHKVFGDMDRFAAEVADALGASSSLALPIGRIYAGWAAASAIPDGGALPRGRNGLRVAVSRVGRGLEGFRRTHQEALLARRVTSLVQRPSTACVSFGNVALDSLLVQDVEEARRFVAHELGPLTEDSDGNRRITATLEVFLQEETSFVRAARRLGVHENTVAYRIRRAETLLGRKVGERQLELRAALRMMRFVGQDPAA